MDGWWNFSPSDADDYAWVSYDCQSYSESCGDERGILISGGESVTFSPATNNPFFGLNHDAVYFVSLDILTTVYSTVGGYYAGVYGSSTSQSGTLDLFGTYNVPNPDQVTCKSIEIALNMSLDATDKHISEYEYIIFTLTRDDPRTATEETPTIEGVMDGLNNCSLLEVSVNNDDCDYVCIEVEVDESCGSSGNPIENCSNCTFQIQVLVDEQVVYSDEIDPFDGSFTTCFDPNGEKEFTIQYVYEFYIGTETQYRFDEIEYSISCEDVTVSSSATWNASNLPGGSRLNELKIESGGTLTIADDVTLEFCPGGKLIIEPNAELRLYGQLTSACDEGWDGIKVYGNSAFGQHFDLTQGVYHQGSLRTFDKSVIEHARTAVQLFGPNPDDTGGRIVSAGTSFLNNQFGVIFRPYQNLRNGLVYPYFASFENCVFEANNNYMFSSQFYAHIQMIDVQGIQIYGCDFNNAMDISSPTTLWHFGYGIQSFNSGFAVSAKNPDYPDECESPCDRTSFNGLGYGVYAAPAARTLRGRFFALNHSDFTNCYVGASINGVSGWEMLYNQFFLGEVPEPNVMNGDQLGIELRDGMPGFDCQENYFESSDINTNATIGICVGNIGLYNNVIRRNEFNGLTVSNEAFGENGYTPPVDLTDGLLYYCNINTATEDKDIYVHKKEGVQFNTISPLQATVLESQSFYTGAGNIFASTGDASDGDIANYGNNQIAYYCVVADVDQYPDVAVGLSSIVNAESNPCLSDHCIPPCPNPLEDEKDDFNDALLLYLNAVTSEHWDTASAYKTVMDWKAMRIIQYYLRDTASTADDSLVVWYTNLRSPHGDILHANHLASNEDFTTANQVIEAIPSKYDLSDLWEDDLDSIQVIYDILSARSADSLYLSDLTTLEAIAERAGHSASMARGILSLHGYYFMPEYYLPEKEEFEEFAQPLLPATPSELGSVVTIHPNPATHGKFSVVVPHNLIQGQARLELVDVNGRIILESLVNVGGNDINIGNRIPAGVYYYRVTEKDLLRGSGKIVLD